ncbi:MAG: hypothetical protein QM478_05410 [Flavobacteriaceae bacterium]
MKKSILKKIGVVAIVGILIASGIIYYMFNKPHRDVQASKVDYTLTATEIVSEYLNDSESANTKYLDEAGNSKIVAITGEIYSISTDQKNQKVVLLKSANDKAGVSCTFTEATNMNAEKLQKGQTVTIKGVIRSGAGFDKDLDLYEDVIVEKSDVI